MSIDPRQPASPSAHGASARAAMMARVQEQLTSRRRSEDRRCPLCGEPIRGGQACISLHGTTVHDRCRSASR
ncbi:MAG: hypothetical protein KY463_01970 [Actinobacteria bacterium]|nr:hypothetical protein [Actinomycetota bacterium]